MATQSKKAFTFAHLLSAAGIRADSGKGDDEQDQDDERAQRDGESDEDYAKRMEELDKKEADDKDGTDDAGAEDEEDPEADDAGESSKEKAARARERARCATIFGSKAAASRPDFAAHLAFNTSMSAKAAVGMLNAFAAGDAPAAPQKSLASRMASVPAQNVGVPGAAAPASSPQGAAAMIIQAGKMRRGEV